MRCRIRNPHEAVDFFHRLKFFLPPLLSPLALEVVSQFYAHSAHFFADTVLWSLVALRREHELPLLPLALLLMKGLYLPDTPAHDRHETGSRIAGMLLVRFVRVHS